MARTVGVTPSGIAANAPGTVNTPAGEAGTGDRPTILSRKEQEAILGSDQAGREGTDIFDGEIPPGTTGFVDLDENGTPTGEISSVKEPGKSQAAVVNIQALAPDILSTPAGAPLTTNMNPNPDHFDQGMHDRNPPPAQEKTTKQALAEQAEKRAESARASAEKEKDREKA